MTPFDSAVADRQQARAFASAIRDIQTEAETAEVAAPSARQRFDHHFHTCPRSDWPRLSFYRQSLLALEQCASLRQLSGNGLDPKVATLLWEQGFQAATIARRMMQFDRQVAA